MKVVAFNSSPRPEGNTAYMIEQVFEELHKEGIETEMINIGEELLWGCQACGKCSQNKNMRCAIGSDMMNTYVEKMVSADGIIIGSPVYFAGLNAQAKALIDRAGYVLRANGNPLKRRVGVSLAAARRAGALPTLDAINHFFLISDMYLVGSSYWNFAFGRLEGEAADDVEGMKTMQNLGMNMAHLLKKLKIEN
jgi:multimeric flavodoxin WrbA